MESKDCNRDIQIDIYAMMLSPNAHARAQISIHIYRLLGSTTYNLDELYGVARERKRHIIFIYPALQPSNWRTYSLVCSTFSIRV